MEYIIRFSEVPTTQQVEEALKKSKPMALSKISFMEYSSWGLHDLVHGLYIFYHYDQVIYLGTCRSRDFASRIVSHLAAHKNAWMNTLPKYAEKKYKLSSIKEAVEYILEEFSILLIRLPTFPNRSEISEEDVVGVNEKIKKLLQLENELRFLLQPELNTKKQASSPAQRAEGKRKYSVRANQTGRPARNTTVAPVGSEKILVVNVGANLSPTELKEAAAGPWKISEIQKGTKIAAWNGEKIIAVWRLKGSQKEGHQYRLELGATITAAHAAPVSKQLGSKFRMYSRVMVRDYTPPKSRPASGTAERSSFYLTIDDGVLQLDVSEGERLLSSLRDEERAQIHTIQIQAFPNKTLPPLGAFPNLKNMQIQRCENLTDLSVLQHLPQIEQFTLTKCPAIEDFSPLQALSSLSQVTLSDLRHFSDLSVLSNAKGMDVLEFDTLPSFVDLAPIQRLSNLSSLRIEGCTSVSDVSPIGGLAALSSLVMNDCPAHKSVSLFDLPRLKDVVLNDTIEEISYQNLPSLTEFSVSRLPNLKHVSLANMSGLQELRILDCPNLTRLQADDTCDQIQSIYVSACPSLSIDSVLSRQKNIRKLVLSSLESISEVPILKNGEQLTDLSLLCPNLRDLRGLSAYPNLTNLGLSGSAVQDLSPIAGLKNLQELSLNDCSQIKDISPLGGLPKLDNRLYLHGCTGLKEISLSHSPIESISLDDCVEKISLHHCPNIQRLMLNRLPNLSSVSLSHLDALEQIDLRKTPRLLALTDFSSLPKLTTILLRECSALRDISGIQHLSTLSELDIKGCPELQEQALYTTLYTLPQLRTLKSEIPSHMLTQVMAVLAFQRNDVSCIAENMDAWCFAVQQYPTTPGILSALANAASLL
ncbi:MAG: leucine-rich repeat domain-containing protein, partial [Myxococcota bacterium]|nr:leucine-rich repeat domain-containing protein [Myxococcota bacterium]